MIFPVKKDESSRAIQHLLKIYAVQFYESSKIKNILFSLIIVSKYSTTQVIYGIVIEINIWITPD